jgi:hypothetical protein
MARTSCFPRFPQSKNCDLVDQMAWRIPEDYPFRWPLERHERSLQLLPWLLSRLPATSLTSKVSTFIHSYWKRSRRELNATGRFPPIDQSQPIGHPLSVRHDAGQGDPRLVPAIEEENTDHRKKLLRWNGQVCF